MAFVLAFAIALAVTMLLVPPVRRLALAWGAVDRPNERKVHEGTIPRLGGLAILAGAGLSCLLFLPREPRFLPVAGGMALVALVGLLDDTLHLPARWKLLGQMAAALLTVCWGDLRIEALGSALGSSWELGILSLPLTVLWIVGITNAINLSDGLDGLAGGISFIALASFGILAYQRHDLQLSLLCLTLLGATLGFLRYNTHPAEIFMGDTGSLFLGFSLGTLSLLGHFKSLTAVTLLTPILVLLVPIVDTLWAIVRRLRAGKHPFSADKLHLHHRLLALGMNHSQSVSIIYALTAALAALAVLLAESSHFKFVLIPLLLLFMAAVILQAIGKLDFFRWSDRWSQRLDGWFSQNLQAQLAHWCLRLLLLPLLFYTATSLLGLPKAPLPLLGCLAFTLILVLALLSSRSPNADSFLVFTSFFLAALIAFLSRQALENIAIPRIFESILFWTNVAALLGHLIFKRKRELVLTTPLEIMILVLLIGTTAIPPQWQISYHLPFLLFRTIAIFMTFKILLLSHQRVRTTSVSALASGFMLLVFGFFR